MIFFPQDPLKRMRSRKLLEMILAREGAGAAVLAGCAGLPGDSERESAEQYAGDYTVLYPPPGKDRARSGF